MRNALSYATHKFFQENGFVWVSSPIITASDCEGAGEQFCVTTLVCIVDLICHIIYVVFSKIPNRCSSAICALSLHINYLF